MTRGAPRSKALGILAWKWGQGQWALEEPGVAARLCLGGLRTSGGLLPLTRAWAAAQQEHRGRLMWGLTHAPLSDRRSQVSWRRLLELEVPVRRGWCG